MTRQDCQGPDGLWMINGRSAQIPAVQARLGRLARQCPLPHDDEFMVDVGFRHKADIAEVGANVRSWVYTGHSQVAKRNSAVFGVNGGFSKT